MKSRNLLRWAGGTLAGLGAGHLAIAVAAGRTAVADWIRHGAWSTVPFMDQGGQNTTETSHSAITFWSGPAGFAVPQILLGCLIWRLARRESAIPAGYGWALTGWSALNALLLGPSPFFAGIVPGVLLIVAARKNSQPTNGPSQEMVSA